jgi:hypothetical protein
LIRRDVLWEREVRMMLGSDLTPTRSLSKEREKHGIILLL